MGPRAFDRFVRVTALVVLIAIALVEAIVIGSLLYRIRELEQDSKQIYLERRRN